MEAIEGLIRQPADPPQWMVLRDTVLERHAGEQRTTALLLASHQGLCGCPILAGAAELFCELLKLWRSSCVRASLGGHLQVA